MENSRITGVRVEVYGGFCTQYMLLLDVAYGGWRNNGSIYEVTGEMGRVVSVFRNPYSIVLSRDDVAALRALLAEGPLITVGMPADEAVNALRTIAAGVRLLCA